MAMEQQLAQASMTVRKLLLRCCFIGLASRLGIYLVLFVYTLCQSSCHGTLSIRPLTCFIITLERWQGSDIAMEQELLQTSVDGLAFVEVVDLDEGEDENC